MFLGKHLLVLLDFSSNGTYDAFGVVTRVWDDGAGANLLVFPDAANPRVCTSVPVFGTREEAEAYWQVESAGCHRLAAYHPPART